MADKMAYTEAIAVIRDATGKEHDERCFETGHCDITDEVERALAKSPTDAPDLRLRILLAGGVIRTHLKAYDAEQITPAGGVRK